MGINFKIVLFLLMLSICNSQSNQEYILATNDGEFMKITSFSKQDDGMLVWQKQKPNSPLATDYKVVPYSQIKNIKDINGKVVWDKVNNNTIKNNINFMKLFSWDSFNIGYGNNYSVNNIAEWIGGDKVNIDPRIEPRITLLDISKAKEFLEWSPSTKLENWIQNIIK